MPLLNEVMSTQLHTLSREDSMDQVASVFQNHNIHHIPVVEKDGSLLGIISHTDFERFQHGSTLFRMPERSSYNQSLLRATRITDVMTKDVVELTPTDRLEQAYEIFKENQFRCLPIVDKGVLVGIVTPLDLLKYFFENK